MFGVGPGGQRGVTGLVLAVLVALRAVPELRAIHRHRLAGRSLSLLGQLGELLDRGNPDRAPGERRRLLVPVPPCSPDRQRAVVSVESA
jgi:hypothetical protein